ncbi:hypothetical protein SAMN05660772_02056 [Pasteurella testudinis DSM 23072]|uniref:Uncharacterized protein n=1 Tax=Pasteurella testudinis DSM 23072 TaxID=1122938 RepID=A0A1W1UMK4_9PAST|nr:STY4528 family pathogenicity island replication protein [Pasteurella testudinis]SMB82322.1 hypothetical protein SAMN05660772_02056 [Pasteurella testudinis DSM 23072]SUB51494.1 Uncharacterised protein [Pasteurella testudinis]
MAKEHPAIDSRKIMEHGLLFFGNQHETVPVRLLYDPYLTSRAKFAWLLIKHRAKEFQGGLFPSYEMLGQLLSDRTYNNAILSRKLITQTLIILRLTRWLTLCETVRNHRGQVVGNVYLLHDEPMPILDTIQFNDDYLQLLEKSAKHNDPVIKGVATDIIENLISNKAQWHYLSHVDWMKARYHAYKTRTTDPLLPLSAQQQYLENIQEQLLSSDTELSQTSQNSLSSNMELSQKMNNLQSSNMELSDKSLISGLVPYGNSGTEYSTSTVYINKYCTGDSQELNWPSEIRLSDFEKTIAAKNMKGLDLGLCKAILFEAQQRIIKNEVKKPQSYLYRLIQRAQEGQFKPYLLEHLLEQQLPKREQVPSKIHAAEDYLHQNQPREAQPKRQIDSQQRVDQMRDFRTRLLNR